MVPDVPAMVSRVELVTSKDSTTLSSLVRLRVMLPVPAVTGSSKLATRFAVTATLPASSAGSRLERAGGVVSGPPPLSLSEKLLTVPSTPVLEMARPTAPIDSVSIAVAGRTSV
jgi:hypothetical protein